ncbi:hypothetical protein BSKO_03219 [Bryopsis sp. KO-2023]|nr:hypothetical protein BSKO_03219 [Bryopsis sp. KO-2023]
MDPYGAAPSYMPAPSQTTPAPVAPAPSGLVEPPSGPLSQHLLHQGPPVVPGPSASQGVHPVNPTQSQSLLPTDSCAAEVDLEKHPSGIVPTLQNVVSTCYLGCKLDLKEIAMHARNAEYNPKRFAAVIMRIREPKTTALIFTSGKMVCTGAKSEQDSRLAARKYAKIIMKLGFKEIRFQDFKIQNIVGSCDVKFPIRLEGLHFKHGLFSSYEPELFPGLIYRMKKPKVVLLIFVSGKVVLTGAKHRDEIYKAFENIYPALTEFRKGDGARTLGSGSVSGSLSGRPLESQMPSRSRMGPPTSMMTGCRSLPPPTPSHHGLNSSNPGMSSLPPLTPSHPGIPPPTPAHGGLPPPTPAYGGIPPPTPAHGGIPPPTPAHTSIPPLTPAYGGIPPPTPAHNVVPPSSP